MSYGRVAGWLLPAAALLFAAGCEQDAKKLTQIVVVVDSDLPVPEYLDELHLEVSGTKPMPVFDTKLDADHPLPRTLGIVYSGGKLGPLRVLARGMRQGQTVVERVADVSFRKDRTLKLALPLSRACVNPPECNNEQTCDQGECVPSLVSSLPVFDGKDGSFVLDAGPYIHIDAGAEPDAAEGGSEAGAPDAQPDGAPETDAGASDPIVCTVNKPEESASFYQGDEVVLDGNCVNAKGNPVALRWSSSIDGSLGTKKMLKRNNLSVGVHEISLCGNETTMCAAPVPITVQVLPEIKATIISLAQAGATEGLYRANAELVANAQVSGALPLKISWIDSLAGRACSEETCRFAAPMLTGRHTLRLVVTDARNRVASAERSFIVRDPDHDALFEAYVVANSVLDTYGTISSLASDGSYHYVGTENGFLLQVLSDASQSASPSVTPTALMAPRPSVRDVFVHHSSNTLYMGTSTDVQACDISNGSVSNCAKLAMGGFVSAVPRSVRRVTSEAADYLTVGTSAGLWVGALNALNNGTLRENGSTFNLMGESPGKFWVAASTGLWGYTLGAGGGLSGSPQKFSGASGALTGLVASADNVWATLSSGFTRYDVSAKTWTSWTTNYTQAMFGRLVSNEVRSIAITHPLIDGAAREVIWLATSAGLSRFDAMIPSFTTYTTADGLPDNSVLKVLGLSDNELLLATPTGLVIHHGQ